jgi:hypothetical protein
VEFLRVVTEKYPGSPTNRHQPVLAAVPNTRCPFRGVGDSFLCNELEEPRIDCVSVGIDLMQRNVEPYAQAGGSIAEERIDECHCERGPLRGVCGRQTGGSKTSGQDRT